MGNAGYRTIKIRLDSYERLKKIVDKILRDGWRKIGSNRSDQPTLANAIDEAISRLEHDTPKKV